MNRITQLSIGKMILFHRKKSGLSRNALAEIAGIGKTSLFNIENEQGDVRLDTLLKVMKTLNISISFDSPLMKLFRENEDENS